MNAQAQILSIGTANPDSIYSQDDLIRLFKISDPHLIRLFQSTHIDKRHLYMPAAVEAPNETEQQLLHKHTTGALEIGEQAIKKALSQLSLTTNDIDYLCVVTSTGYLLPALSAYFIKNMNFKKECQRLDIVGMGCNAGLNGLNTVNNWARCNIGQFGLMLCVEICSAMYINDGSLRTSVVNSLFGDGAAAIVVKASENTEQLAPTILSFCSHIITDAIEAMHIEWDENFNKFSFLLHHANPFVIGQHIETPVKNLLNKFNIHQDQIAHWIIHGGGKNVISAVKYNLGLSSYDMRHTTSVLRDYGNLSSASFLFSYERLLQEKIINKGDYGVAITIGPGAQLETALLKW